MAVIQAEARAFSGNHHGPTAVTRGLFAILRRHTHNLNMAQKFVISEGKLILGHVKYHMDLVKDVSKPVGGGYWDEREDRVLLYGSSTDYGSATPEQVRDAEWPVSLQDRRVLFTFDRVIGEDTAFVEITKLDQFADPSKVYKIHALPRFEGPGSYGRNQQYIRGEHKIGRNDPCPCGSWNKHKRCCIGKEAVKA